MSDDKATNLSELDRLRLQLAGEKSARLRAEMASLQMSMKQVQAQIAQHEVDTKSLGETLKKAYDLQPADEIQPDGTIKRAPVRAIKEG